MIQRIVKPAWIVSIILVVYLSLAPRAEIPYPFSAADKLAHGIAYAWLAILPFFGFDSMGAGFTAASLMIPLGIGLEFGQQQVPGRNFSVEDMVADSAGVALGIVVARHLKKRAYFGKSALVDRRKPSP